MDATEPGTPGEWFQFAIELTQTNTLIGDCGLKTEADGHQAEIGFTFSRAYQGRGLASEAVTRLLDYAFCELNLHRVYAITDQEYTTNSLAGEPTSDEYLYAILRDEWLHKPSEGADKEPQGGTT